MVREMELGNNVLEVHNDKPRNMKNIFGHQADLNLFVYSV